MNCVPTILEGEQKYTAHFRYPISGVWMATTKEGLFKDEVYEHQKGEWRSRPVSLNWRPNNCPTCQSHRLEYQTEQ